MNSQDQKTALVTGGNRGIGFAICQGLLEAGFDVFLTARNLEQGQAAVEKLSLGQAQVHLIKLDVSDDESIKSAVSQVSQLTDALDVLVNNAGIYPDEEANILTVSRDLLTKTMDTNTFSPIVITQAFIPLLEKAADPKVINISSGNGQLDGISAGVPSYSLSKLALNGATILLAEALKTKGIAVYAMSPGWVKTDMGGEAAPRTPQEGADTAIWLATEATLQQSGKFFKNRAEQPY